MNTKTVKPSNKKLQLKKAVISNLSMSEEKLKQFIGGYAAKTTDVTSILINTCTSNDTK